MLELKLINISNRGSKYRTAYNETTYTTYGDKLKQILAKQKRVILQVYWKQTKRYKKIMDDLEIHHEYK